MEGSDRRRVRRRAQLRVVVPLSMSWGLGVLLLWATLGTGSVEDAQLLLDPAALAGLPWYTGLISNLGVLAWTLGAVTAAAAAHVADLGQRHGAARFLRQGALLGGFLTLDDLFLLHSSALPDALGVEKRVILAAYFVIAACWLVGNVAEVRRTRWALLLAAGAAMAVSVTLDQVAAGADWRLVAEDGSKFLGVLSWATYFTLTARDIAESVFGELTAARDAQVEQQAPAVDLAR